MTLSEVKIALLDRAFAPGTIEGARYTSEGMAGVNK